MGERNCWFIRCLSQSDSKLNILVIGMKPYNGGVIKLLLLCLVIFSFVSPFYTSFFMSCDVKDIEYNLEESNQIWNQYEDHYYSKRTPAYKSSIEIADNLINKNEIFLLRYWEPFVFNEDELDWSENPYGDWTWQFYFHSLRMVSYLINAYELKGEVSYLEKAKWFIQSWDEHNPCRFQQASIFAWDDHSTANRITTLIYFWDNYRDSEIFDSEFANQILNMLYQHGEFTANDANYIWKHNHGIFQDISLLQLATLFPNLDQSDKWLEISISRLSHQIDHGVTETGVHKEHSTEYHYLVLKLLSGISNFTHHYNISFDKLDTTIYNMEEYLVHISKPNGFTPLVGDSVMIDILKTPVSSITNEHLLYLVTGGNNGEKITENNIVYEDAGVAIFKNNWDNNSPLYFSLFNSYHSNVHKQADDLSFVLTHEDTDYFVDSGKFAADSAYHEENIFRTYVKSVFAHNTIAVDDTSFNIRDKINVGKSIIESYGVTSNYSYVKASHTHYDGVKITRTAIFFEEGAVYFHDEIQSNEVHKYTQIFNIGEGVNVNETNEYNIQLSSNIDNSNLTLKQLDNKSELEIYSGSYDPMRGWQSTILTEANPITSLNFEKHGKNVNFNTVINIEVDIVNVQLIDSNDNICYVINFDNGDTQLIEIKS